MICVYWLSLYEGLIETPYFTENSLLRRGCTTLSVYKDQKVMPDLSCLNLSPFKITEKAIHIVPFPRKQV